MQRLADSFELREAAQLLGAILEDSDQLSGPAARGERLRDELSQLCVRARFAGAAVADAQGLLLASHAFPYSTEAAGALASVLGETLAKFQSVTGEARADAVSLDVGFADKLVARRFSADDESYFILASCEQSVDERAELELSIETIRAIVGKGPRE
jgi:hypothetical protein